jgi:two-component system, NarL family, captular synthesis response regulator RcsB
MPALSEQARLSPREREVLRCVLDGMAVTAIARKFSRSVNTISTQKQAAYRKLGIRSDAELFKVQHSLSTINA